MGRAPGPFALTRHRAGSAQHRADLAELQRREVAVPYEYLTEQGAAYWWWRVTQGDHLVSGLLAHVARSRTVPGTHLVRCERVGRSLHEPIAHELGPLIRGAATAHGAVLRVNVALFDEEPARRERYAAALAAAGFTSVSARSYRTTLRVDLTRDLHEVMAGFSWSTRRNIRQAKRHGLTVQRLTSATYAPRCDALHREAFARTDQPPPALDTKRLFDTSDGHTAILLGVFAPTSLPAPPELLAFAWVTSHGDVATYEVAGSTRTVVAKGVTPGDLLMLGCIEWARERGHRWLDLGGVTTADASGHDPLAGISAFKRGFSRHEVQVGEEWEHRPSALLHAAERVARRLVAMTRP